MSVDLLLQLHEQCKGLLAKSDGKDKTIALLQYAAMFASGGEPGTALAVQKSLAAARKPFRLYKPIEILVPFLRSPAATASLSSLLASVMSSAASVRAVSYTHLTLLTICSV